jgi:predicted permease
MRAWITRLADRLRRDRLDAELREELEFHRRMLARDGHEANRLGNTTLHRERARDLWSLGRLDVLAHDARYALRGLRRAPGFTAVVTLTLGLGIGANVAIFDVTDRLMFRPFPYLRHPATVDRVYLRTTISGRTTTSSTYPYTRFIDLRREATSIAAAAGITEWRLAVGSGDAAQERQVVGASASLFEFFDAPPSLGRYFTAAEDAVPRGADVAVVSYGYWMTALGGRNVIGEKLQVGPLVLSIVGVAPRGFVGLSEGEPPAVFVPITTLVYGVNQGDAESFAQRYNWDWMSMVVRRKPGVSVEHATADLTRAFVLSRARQRETTPTVLPANLAHPVAIAGALRMAASPAAGLEARTLIWVNGVAVIVLLVACANVLNLTLGRLFARRREIAVRLSLGVSRRRLASFFIIEGMIVAALGCAAGVVIAQCVWSALRAMIVRDGGTDPIIGDGRALAIACLAALIAALAISVGPALLAPRDNVAATLRSARMSGDARASRLRAGLLVLQAALSVVLLIGAGLFVRSLDNVRSVRLGWDPRPVLTVVPNYRGVELDTAAASAVRRALMETARSFPGVTGVARVNSLPFATSYQRLFVAGIDSVERLGRFNYQATTPEYFHVIGTRIVRGRGFTPTERGDQGQVAVISASMARTLWPGVDAIGQCFGIRSATAPCTRVIGIAEDAVQQNIADADRLLYYIPDEGPLLVRPANRLWVRFGDDDPAVHVEALRRALTRVMPPPGYVTVSPLQDLVDFQGRSWRLGATLFVAFGALALVVAAVGLYGVISYGVTQRMHELAVRMALGAQRGNVVRLVIAQAVGFAAAGIAIGLTGAALAAPAVQPLLFDEPARDPMVFGLVGAVVVAVALVAGVVPAARATRADPSAALRAS